MEQGTCRRLGLPESIKSLLKSHSAFAALFVPLDRGRLHVEGRMFVPLLCHAGEARRERLCGSMRNVDRKKRLCRAERSGVPPNVSQCPK